MNCERDCVIIYMRTYSLLIYVNLNPVLYALPNLYPNRDPENDQCPR